MCDDIVGTQPASRHRISNCRLATHGTMQQSERDAIRIAGGVASAAHPSPVPERTGQGLLGEILGDTAVGPREFKSSHQPAVVAAEELDEVGAGRVHGISLPRQPLAGGCFTGFSPGGGRHSAGTSCCLSGTLVLLGVVDTEATT